MPRLVFDHLTRFSAVDAALARVLGDTPARVLDVGGYPGAFAKFAREAGRPWKIETADVVDAELEGYHRITSGALPFDAGAFDAVVTIDTLEHVAAANRGRFIGDLARVAKTAIVLAAPMHHDATASVESALCTMHEQIFAQPHRWLAEHRTNGLPRIAEIPGALPRDFGITRLDADASLVEWLLWQWGQLARETRDEFAPSFIALDSALSDGVSGNSAQSAPHGYRAVLTIARGAATSPDVRARIDGWENAETEDTRLAPALAAMLSDVLLATGGESNAERGVEMMFTIKDRLSRSMEMLEKKAAGQSRGLRKLLGKREK